MILVVSVVLVFAVTGVAVAVWRSTDALLRARSHSPVVLETKSGETFRGVLAACDARTVVLRNVEVVGAGSSANTVVDGELLVPRTDVKFLQRP